MQRINVAITTRCTVIFPFPGLHVSADLPDTELATNPLPAGAGIPALAADGAADHDAGGAHDQ